MRSPVYDSEKDMVVVSPEGRFVSFCLYWLDTSNRSGYIEPLGTHPEFRNRGLAKAVLRAVIQRIKGSGMRTACLCV